MQVPDLKKITTDHVELSLLKEKNVRLDVLRLDKLHPVISGNKWFKLKYHLVNFNAGNYKGIITFGGAWSNHIVATACMCQIEKIKSVGVIRGEKPLQLSATLKEASSYGMELKFIDRETYRTKTNNNFINQLRIEFPDHYIIPEGGCGETGEKGAAEIIHYANGNIYTHVACAVGTGTMFNGIRISLNSHQTLSGIVVLKGWDTQNQNEKSSFNMEYHFGGYAKHTPELLSFMNEFYSGTGIPTDFVYTGKLAYGLIDQVRKDQFKPGSRILMIHSGGLQGNASLQKGSLIF